MRTHSTYPRQLGYSLVELVTVMALTGVLAVGLGNLLQHPFRGYAAVSRRAELVALTDVATGRLARDIRRALPNSIRIGAGGTAIEFLHTAGGARYRATPGVNDPGGSEETDHTDASDWLSFGGDQSWNLIGRLSLPGLIYGAALPGGTRIAIYPASSNLWSEAAANAAAGSISPGAVSVTVINDGDEDQIRLGANHQFTLESPARRLFVVDTPVTYLCESGGSSADLYRIDHYAISANQPIQRGAAPLATGNQTLMGESIERCEFTYAGGTASRAGIVTVEIVLAQSDERIRLLKQIQVENAP